jgi:lysyl-tRNA synthetase class 2
MIFYDITCDGSKIQVMSVEQDYVEAESEFSFVDAHRFIHRGDIMGVRGAVGKSKKGELSIFPVEVRLLSACLHMLPKPQFGLKDQEVFVLTIFSLPFPSDSLQAEVLGSHSQPAR